MEVLKTESVVMENRTYYRHILFLLCAILGALSCIVIYPGFAHCESSVGWRAGDAQQERTTGYDVFNIFGGNYSAEMPKTRIVEVEKTKNNASSPKMSERLEPAPNVEEVDPYELLKDTSNVFVSSDPKSQLIDPEKDPKVRINPEAPGPFIGMALAHQQGKRELATRYASQYVRYLVNLMYEVSDLTRYVTDALVRERMASEEEVVGVSQYLDYEFARSRAESHAIVKPTHDLALQRVKADPQQEVYVYYLFTLSCQYCRDMAPDIERLWQVAKGDKRIKMAALVLGDAPSAWVKSYREYTGLTIPIVPAGDMAKALRIRFLPALVVMSPNTNTTYLKTGQIEFSRMYELVRTVQGLPIEMTPEVYNLAYKTRIGEIEKTGKGQKIALSSKDSLALGTSNNIRSDGKKALQRFSEPSELKKL